MIDGLEQFVGNARWFGGKGRSFRITEVRPLGWLAPSDPQGPRVRIELVLVHYDDGPTGSGPEATEMYQLPLVYYAEPQERLEHALVGHVEDGDAGPAYVYDAVHDREATVLFLNAFHEGGEHDGLLFHRLKGYDLDLGSRSTLFTGEQSNSSLAFGEDSLMKVFRKVTPGRNPDIEIHEALTNAGSDHVATLYGWLETADTVHGAPLQLAMLQQFLRTASDGWGLALASVRDLFAEADLHADEVGGDFAAETHRLGVATAEVHSALAEQFPSETWGPERTDELAEAMTGRLEAALSVVPALEPHADALREVFAAVRDVREPFVVQRVHGDFHLGQTLRTVKGWKIVDFEGEPVKPLAERVRPDSAWRDVAGMLRSFDYAAHSVATDVQVDADSVAQIAYRAQEWVERNQEAFLAGYAEARGALRGPGEEGIHAVSEPLASDSTGGELTDDETTLLRAYVLDKAVYETVYETRNRPTWLHIPLDAVERLLRPAGSGPTSPDDPEVTDP